MRALRFYDAKDLRIDTIPSPEITLDEVRLRVAYCGICGTDMHEYLAGPVMLARKDERNKHTGAGLPQILGHELSGTIIEVGSDVQKFQPGQRVTVNVAMDDRHHGYDPCELCRSGRHNICAHSTFYGINAKGGGFADEIAVKAVALVPLPDNVSLKVAALAEPLSVAAHMVRTSGFRQGQDAVVLGAGPIGSAITFLLKDSGARKIIVSEVESSRAEQARLCGADRVINPAEEDALIAIKNKMGIGADVTFDACGFQVTLDTAIACTKPGGTIFNVAIHEKPLTLDMGQSPLSSFMLSTVLTCFANLLTIPEKKIMTGNAYTAEDFERVIQILSSRGADVERFITAVVPLENAVDGGFSELVHNKSKHNKILIEVGGEDM